MFKQPQNSNSLRDMGNKTMHMVLEGELAVKLHAMDVEVGTSPDRNQRQDQKVKSSMARCLPVENLPPQNVGSIINYL